jgi:cytochrome P450
VGRLPLDPGTPGSRARIAGNRCCTGFGIHRCVGARLAGLQLRILFEELAIRRLVPAVTGPVERVNSSFRNGHCRLPVTLARA